MNILRNHQGVTLIELLVAIAVSVIAGSLIMTIFVQNTGVFNNQQAKVTHGLNINDALESINSNIRQSSSVATVYPPQGQSIHTTSSDTLILAVPSIDASGNIIDQKFDYIVVTQDSITPQILREKLFPDPVSHRSSYSKVLSSNLLSLQFTFLDDNKQVVSPAQATLINYTLRLTSQHGLQIIQSSASGQTRIRNL